jgi:hypothetical protein
MFAVVPVSGYDGDCLAQAQQLELCSLYKQSLSTKSIHSRHVSHYDRYSTEPVYHNGLFAQARTPHLIYWRWQPAEWGGAT